jgi:hypothetical protein
MKSKIAALEKFVEENNCHIRKLKATIQEMKERTRSEIQFMKEELEKTPLLRKIRKMSEEIISLKERSPPLTEKDT